MPFYSKYCEFIQIDAKLILTRNLYFNKVYVLFDYIQSFKKLTLSIKMGSNKILIGLLVQCLVCSVTWAGGCPDNWAKAPYGTCYSVTNMTGTLAENKEYCQQQNATLVRVNNMEEERYLETLPGWSTLNDNNLPYGHWLDCNSNHTLASSQLIRADPRQNHIEMECVDESSQKFPVMSRFTYPVTMNGNTYKWRVKYYDQNTQSNFLCQKSVENQEQDNTVADETCPVNMIRSPSGKCYMITQRSGTWDQNKQYCLRKGLNMVSFQNDLEKEQFRLTAPRITGRLAVNNPKYWLGALYTNSQLYSIDGKPLDFLTHDSTPSCGTGTCPIYIQYHSFDWQLHLENMDDKNINAHHKFMCQSPSPNELKENLEPTVIGAC
jgi:hypothetical protein